jgi:Fur family zinc uptake transcriptional regulator
MKTSPYKDKILKLFQKVHTLSIADVCKKIPEADFSTIFRNVEMLTQEGKLKKIVVDKDITVYEANDSAHHHDHFICVECGDVDAVHVSGSVLKGSKARVEDVVIRGVCEDCNC